MVNVEQGAVRGAVTHEVARFLGIPFAAAPTGAMRWRAPQPAAAWKGVRAATGFGASCQQDAPPPNGFGPWTHEYNITGPISEDCLYLNVWTPAKRSTARLPVMVWIHGGGFNSGGASVAIYDAAAMAMRGVVVISINYRLGIYGFLAHPELAGQPGGGNGNFGLLDQIAALRWVQRNAAAFGGDPAQVTIAGQSAGAMSVNDLILSPLAKGLFQRAIAQSGSGMGLPPITLAAAETDGKAILAASGARSIADLRALTTAQIKIALTKSARPGAGMLRFAPIADGTVLPTDPDKALDEGRYNDTPILTGLNADEGSGFMPIYRPTDAQAYGDILNQRFGADAASFATLYPASQPTSSLPAMQRDRGIAGLLFWSEARAKTSRFPIWRYLFTRAEPGPERAKYGAFHSSEIPYVLGTLDKAPERSVTPEDERVSEAMGQYWASFIKTGNPNAAGLVSWPRNDSPNQLMELGAAFGARPAMRPEALNHFRAYVAKGGAVSIF
ncbi:carboxylesterase family protein [Sphingomonas sp. BIUV-7]|uniref:Carboxylic ester hydrolase n=2 Tax=Sphingomonas natans TaxID=3063330 RepID=A0ABT8YAC9_9SPHN|nr:carboxylesterase family protein [Sphingomonas sp. BIUV-7]MDO6415284.1 carboxylesterase family protein [Sphingomonas sp. BIUV-7]